MQKWVCEHTFQMFFNKGDRANILTFLLKNFQDQLACAWNCEEYKMIEWVSWLYMLYILWLSQEVLGVW